MRRCYLGGLDSKDFACNAGDLGLIPGWVRSPGERNGYLLQYSCLENSTDSGACGLQSVGSQRVGHDWKTNTKFSSVQVWDFPCGQDCASPVGGMGSIHGWGTKILHAVWYSQKIIFKKMCPDLGLKLYQLVWACRLKTREKYKKANSLLLFWPYGTFQKPSGQPYRTPGFLDVLF